MSAERVLPYGQFIGQTADAVQSDGFRFSEVIHRGNQHVPVHTHADSHFLLIVAGDYVTSAREGKTRCRPGSLIFNPPGTTHRDRFRSETGRFFTLSLQPERYRLLSDGAAPGEAVCFGEGGESWLAARMYREFRHRDSLSPIVLQGIALELLGTAARSERFGSGTGPAWIALAIEMIRERCVFQLRVSDIAAEVGVHPYHLCRSFRRFLGVTPGEFIRSCRLERAMTLVRDSKLSLSTVALECGYADQSQFTRSFRRTTGTTPGQMRRDLGWQRD